MSRKSLVYGEWKPELESLRETLCTLGNGYFATRGAAEESKAGGPHYPGTYLAGGYNRLKTEIAGRTIENEDLVNWPNWLCLRFRIEEGDWFDLSSVDLLDFRQELDMENGVLSRSLRFRDLQGRETLLESRRLVHMAFRHLAALEWKLIPQNWSETIEVHSGLDGSVKNWGVERYRELNGQHLETLKTGACEDRIHLLVQTNQSNLRMAQAARTRVFTENLLCAVERREIQTEGQIIQSLFVKCVQQIPIRIEKIIALYTSRDHAISEPCLAAEQEVERSGDFENLLQSHRLAWSKLWSRCDISLDSEATESTQLILHLHIFHLLQSSSLHCTDLDVGVTARGLHGEAYRGHVFWDELFIFPFLNLRLPELVRSLIMYRYRRLEEARHSASEAGYRGAMFPWQSGSDGREESQKLHLNPKSGRWVPDFTYRQRHVNAAIAYNIWQYYQTTGDVEFLSFYGAEMFLEIARFWANLAVYNPDRGRYEIRGVVGPDEFHTHYPGSDAVGIDNNAYTNVMASWVLGCAAQILKILGEREEEELRARIGLSEEEFVHWNEIRTHLFVPFHYVEGKALLSQFEGYERLQELDWKSYRARYGKDIQRLDRILEAEGDDVNRYKACKQADVLMLFYLFSAQELTGIFQALGYDFQAEMISPHIQYYLQRTSHGSTLSWVVHSWVLARLDRKQSWSLFESALNSDIVDIQGGTTSEGIHLGAMAGTVDLVQRCYTGIELRDETLWFNPNLPEGLGDLNFRIRFRGHWLGVRVNQKKLVIHSEKSWYRPIQVGFGNETFLISQDETKTFLLHRKDGPQKTPDSTITELSEKEKEHG